ncbi:MAG TPA: sulfite exporter TauE/SafE family protein [Candidatus Saccharimonadales bacterium]|nr:sulfite exporter TauE/SafE family protein [Candidatus Saccharimonadales bacterium]
MNKDKNTIKKAIIDIKGMHCNSCEILIEEEIIKIPKVTKCLVSQQKGKAEVYFKGTLYTDELEKAVKEAGYALGKDERPFFSHNPKEYRDLAIAAVVLLGLFYLANNIGLFKLGAKVGGNFNNLPIVFLIGVTAGLSTCMALVGGLVLGASARFAEKHPNATPMQKFKPHIFFNIGRIVSYTVLGGVIGYLGSFFQLSTSVLGGLTITVGMVMLLLGVQLIEIFPRLNRFKLTLPKQVSRVFGVQKQATKEYSHTNSMVMGGLTFFLPCGFTQAMQLFAMASGSPVIGATTLGVFALGTAPGLLGIGGLTSVVKGAFAKRFFKFAGLVVIALSLLNISNGINLAGIHISQPVSKTSAQTIDPNVKLENGVQVVSMTESASGYSPSSFTIQNGIPVKWVINAKDISTCASSIVSSQLNIRQGLHQGINTIGFTPTQEGTVNFSCIMGMYTGQFNVVAKTSAIQAKPKASNYATNIKTVPTTSPDSQQGAEAQIIKTTYTKNTDIQPNQFTVKAGQPVRFVINPQDDGYGCMGSIMIPGLTSQPEFIQKGKEIAFTFTPQQGTYNITCAMGTPRGQIVAN